MTWREGYFLQAESDFSTFREFNEQMKPISHQLHYFQMATEKLAKAYLCSSGNRPYRKTHYALVRFLKLSKRHPKIPRLLGYPGNYLAYRSYIDSLLDIATKVEDLAPVGGNHDKANAEYPWEDAAGNVVAPIQYGFPELPKTELIKLRILVINLFRIARRV